MDRNNLFLTVLMVGVRKLPFNDHMYGLTELPRAPTSFASLHVKVVVLTSI